MPIIHLKEYGLYVCPNGDVYAQPANYERATRLKLRKPARTFAGYMTVKTKPGSVIKRMMVHRLVATAFLDNPEHKPFVNHIDGNKANNHVGNLEWCTASENSLHYTRVLLKNPEYLKKNPSGPYSKMKYY